MKTQQKQSQIYKLKGIDLSDEYAEGSFRGTLNISSRRYPYVTTRKGREKLDGYSNVSALSTWNNLIVVEGTDLKYGNTVVGQVSAVGSGGYLGRPKQFAVMNTKVVIFPDKKYLDLSNPSAPTLKNMAVDLTITDSIAYTIPQLSDEFQRFTIAGGYETYKDLFGDLKKDDWVFVTADSEENKLSFQKIENNNGDLVIEFLKVGLTFSTTSYSTLRIERRIPDLDFICSSTNRLFGCVREEQTIYASSFADPDNFWDFSGANTDNGQAQDSWAAQTGTEGFFTGCAKLGSSAVFFKEHSVTKILGTTPDDYRLYDYDIDGVKEGCYQSILPINDALYFMSPNGVAVFGGNVTTVISHALGKKDYTDVVAGTDGERYIMSAKLGDEWRLITFDLSRKMWLKEDNSHVESFVRYDNNLIMLIDGKLYKYDKGDFDGEWSIVFNPVHEANYNHYGQVTSSILEKKKYSKLIMRIEVNDYVQIEVRCDEGRWKEIDKIVNKKGVFTTAVPIDRCDTFEVKLSGRGEFTLMAIERIYHKGSERNE